jgi:hypothetical protein
MIGSLGRRSWKPPAEKYPAGGWWSSGGHLSAALGAATARRYAFLHSVETLAVAGALLADLRAFGAGVLMVPGADQHEMRSGPADFGARYHQPEVRRRDMFPAPFQTVAHRRADADGVAAQTLVDAPLHFGTELMAH